MDLNKKSLKEFNKIVAKKKKEINLEKLFENDNYLVQTLKRTKRVLFENPEQELELKLEKALDRIYKKITLLNDPEIKVYNTENNAFTKKYADFLKSSENSDSLSFNDLIKHYLKSGYKIPNLDFEHNLFKVNPLIEENSNKMTNYFLSQHKRKLSHKDILVLKSLLFLNKLNTLIFCKQKKKRASTVNPLNKAQIKIKYYEEKEEINKLKEKIEGIKRLINQMEIEEKSKKTHFNYSQRNSHQFISSYKKLNSFKEHPILQRNAALKEIKSDLKPNLKLDQVENTDNNEINSKNSIKEISKTADKPFRDYIESKFSQKSSKNNTILRNKRNSFFPGRFRNFNMTTDKKILPILPFSLKTVNNFNKRNKFIKFNINNKSKENEDMGLFARTQIKNKKPNKFYSLAKRKNIESRNKNNNIYSTTFTNKAEFFDFTYRRLKRGNFDGINKLVKKYLIEVEQKTGEEIDKIINKYDYKNFKFNLKELEMFINKKEIDRKIEKIYLNNFISKRVSKPLESMRKKEEQISRLNKFVTAIGNHTE